MANEVDQIQEIQNDPRARYIALELTPEKKAIMNEMMNRFIDECVEKLTPPEALFMLDILEDAVKTAAGMEKAVVINVPKGIDPNSLMHSGKLNQS